MPGFAWIELYNMPLDLRKFYGKLVVEKIQRHNDQVNQQNKQTKSPFVNPKLPR